MNYIFRSAREAVGALIEQTIPGDFVRVQAQGGEAPVYGRVLAPEDPALAQMRPNPGRTYIQVASGEIQEFDPADLEKVSAMEVPSELMPALTSSEDASLAQEVLGSLDPDLVEEFGLGQSRLGGRGSRTGTRDPMADPMKSASASLAQRMPDTRRKKSRAMKKNWRRAKSRSGRPQLGNEPQAVRQNPMHTTFESLIEQELDRLTGAMEAPADRGTEGGEAFSEQPTKFTDNNAVDPRVAYNMTMRVFEATNELMKNLALSKGTPYYMWLQDDPETGTIRMKINGTCPKEIMEKFVRNVEDLELVLLEKPEGDESQRDMVGNWVFETKLPGFPDEYEEPEYSPEPQQFGQPGEYPGEVVLPEEPTGPAIGA
jgi:hypothetical protein